MPFLADAMTVYKKSNLGQNFLYNMREIVRLVVLMKTGCALTQQKYITEQTEMIFSARLDG